MARPRKNAGQRQESLPIPAEIPVEEQPYALPEGWKWVRLLSTFTNLTDSKKKLPQKEYVKEGAIPVVDQGQNLIGGYCDKKMLAYEGSLPVIIFGDHTRCVKYVDFKFIQGADGIKVLRPHPFFYSKFFYYAIINLSIPNLGYRRHFPLFHQYNLPLPPLDVQKRIVRHIESLFVKLDAAKEKAEAVLESFEIRKAAILHNAFTGELTAKWREEKGIVKISDTIKINDILDDIKYGTSEKSDYKYSGVPVIRIPNIADGKVDLTDLKFLKSSTVSDYDLVKLNDILMIRSNGSRELVGKCALVDESIAGKAYASFLIRLRPKSTVIPEFLLAFLNSSDARNQLFAKAKSSAGINNINSKEIGAVDILLPNKEEQQEITRILDDLLEKEQKIKDAAENVLERIDLMKKAILAKAFRGEL
ncbi:restriction endonuclease subunit S [Desulfovibrio sp.]|uniref:restriction endonuclease subunit S n=1 Tax=Desulfovibrio sp. TaxID=885 RepID=UPI0030787D3B